MAVSQPVIKKIKDHREALDIFEKISLPAEDEKTQEIIMNFPTVYIHNWMESGYFEVYVGESNDIFKRTRQHYDSIDDTTKWQNKLLKKDATLFIIGHEHFNKSLTLDIENRLMHYMMSADRVKHVYNLRDNPQKSYYPMEELDEIFGKIWRGLRKENKELFPTESSIKDSAIYKASPLHKLTKDQEKARELIIQKVNKALSHGDNEQFWEAQILEQYRNQAKVSNNYLLLDKQLRMHADPDTMDWIDSFTKKGELKKIPKPFDKYTIKIFDNPEELNTEIKKKASEADSTLSRLIATYDWEYSANHRPEDRLKYWEVNIGKWHKPWNRELEAELSRKQKRQIKGLAWAEQPQTINEVGSTFTIQGFDLNYAGVILGPSVKYREGKIVFDPSESHNNKAIRNRTLSDGSKKKFGEILIQHEVRVLMTRGVNGLYIYACDEQLREALKEAAK